MHADPWAPTLKSLISWYGTKLGTQMFNNFLGEVRCRRYREPPLGSTGLKAFPVQGLNLWDALIPALFTRSPPIQTENPELIRSQYPDSQSENSTYKPSPVCHKRTRELSPLFIHSHSTKRAQCLVLETRFSCPSVTVRLEK